MTEVVVGVLLRMIMQGDLIAERLEEVALTVPLSPALGDLLAASDAWRADRWSEEVLAFVGWALETREGREAVGI